MKNSVNQLRSFVRKIRIYLIETFLVPVTVSKCTGPNGHEFKVTHFQQYRIGKSKHTITTHKCKHCKIIRKYDTKY